MQTSLIKTITIVGGGTAGWMTAALLSKLLLGRFQITLIESEDIGTIGVGEATIPAIKVFNQLLDLDEVEFLKATQGTFKLGIEFVNWRDKGHSYIHGFGKIGVDLMWLHTHQFWLKMFPKGGVKDFDHYGLNTLAARRNRFKMRRPDDSPPMSDMDYAYHFDASLYARHLRGLSERREVRRIEGRITQVVLRPDNGYIDSVVLENGQAVGGDLFIDCSGMRGLLIGEALGVGYEDWNHWLLNDRAYAVPCAHRGTGAGVSESLTPYTRSIAHASGWQWRIPLQHRIGNGHVYSSAYLSDDEAATTLLKNLDGQALADPRQVRFRPGKRQRAFEKNCVAIGLSGGFLEPLESTSIHLIQTGILRLLALFPGQSFDARDIAEYNAQTDFEYRDVRDFIIAHYKVTDREDTPYWAYLKHMDIPDSLAQRIELFRSSARFFKHSAAELFHEESWVQVLLGQGLDMRYDPMVDMIPEDQITAYLRDIEEVISEYADGMPIHADFIARYCKAPPL
ncbi:tryptophan halogenase [Asticcacaulis sp. AC466]|uniref:tryptophan halogenase family protein n=1 Tax=Asticcacaulis sp. AC466 TaxID=1282362 RepID=UPI0003C3ECE5|nr:tryptophan halogenase family protein [Asticcacaulis sp. AC466]ESQ84162.1 tryptophan halogenase [Asticcacaulis sp. AC466]